MKKSRNKTSQASQEPAKTKFPLWICFYSNFNVKEIDSVGDKTMGFCSDECGFKSLLPLMFFISFIFLINSWKFWKNCRWESLKIKITQFSIIKCKTKALLALNILESELSLSFLSSRCDYINIEWKIRPRCWWSTPHMVDRVKVLKTFSLLLY